MALFALSCPGVLAAQRRAASSSPEGSARCVSPSQLAPRNLAVHEVEKHVVGCQPVEEGVDAAGAQQPAAAPARARAEVLPSRRAVGAAGGTCSRLTGGAGGRARGERQSSSCEQRCHASERGGRLRSLPSL